MLKQLEVRGLSVPLRLLTLIRNRTSVRKKVHGANYFVVYTLYYDYVHHSVVKFLDEVINYKLIVHSS